MKTVKGMPITGAQPEFSRKNPLVPNAKDTSADEQTMIADAPSPFKNNQQTPQIPAGRGARGAVPGPNQKPYAGLERTNLGARALPSGDAVGQRRPINQSGQVNGRFGTSFPKKVGSYPNGYPSKRNAHFYGE